MIEKLTKELKDKIASFDICKPYVWLLKLSEADFNELEVCLNDIASANGFSALVSPQFAIETIIYPTLFIVDSFQVIKTDMGTI